jgi:hypothetical protein
LSDSIPPLNLVGARLPMLSPFGGVVRPADGPEAEAGVTRVISPYTPGRWAYRCGPSGPRAGAAGEGAVRFGDCRLRSAAGGGGGPGGRPERCRAGRRRPDDVRALRPADRKATTFYGRRRVGGDEPPSIVFDTSRAESVVT